MSRVPRPSRRRLTTFLLRDYASREQGDLQVITNAIHAALEYSPLMVAPPTSHDDVFAYVTREIQRRFWTDIYVERPEIREILFTLETGQLVIVTGERGTGKSTAIQAVVQDVTGQMSKFTASPARRAQATNLIPYVFDANKFSEQMSDEQSASDTIHREIYTFLNRTVRDRAGWLAYLYEHDLAFEQFNLRVASEGLAPSGPEDWRFLGAQPEYAELIESCSAQFTATSYRERLPRLLAFIGERTCYEPLLVIDNLDHLDNAVVRRVGEALSAIIGSSPHRVRGAIAVRPENADEIQHVLDTAVRPPRISMMQRPLTPGKYEKPSIDVTLSFLEKRIAVLQEPATVAAIRRAIDPAGASRLAESAGLSPDDSVDVFLGAVFELLSLMVYDIFRTDEPDEELNRDNWDFARAVHSWHNGSLRECGLSLTTFASDILQDKTHTYQLRELLRSVVASREENTILRRGRLRRVTRSLLYRHLLFWGAPDDDTLRPLKNVMVFDGDEESTDPPIHFLRLRLLQYLARRGRGRATVANIRHDLGKLGIEEERIDEALWEIAVKRSQDDAGLVRIDKLDGFVPGARLRPDASVQLLDAGRFLIDQLYVTVEYLFWSAVTTPAAHAVVRLPANVTSEDIQSDAFRTSVAVRFLEGHLVEKFCDEHPFLRGHSAQWTTRRARRHLARYQTLFGFSQGKWFLNRAASSLRGFVPSRDPAHEFADANEAVERLERLAGYLDRIAGTPADA